MKLKRQNRKKRMVRNPKKYKYNSTISQCQLLKKKIYNLCPLNHIFNCILKKNNS